MSAWSDQSRPVQGLSPNHLDPASGCPQAYTLLGLIPMEAVFFFLSSSFISCIENHYFDTIFYFSWV